jgi:hypothetical protein
MQAALTKGTAAALETKNLFTVLPPLLLLNNQPVRSLGLKDGQFLHLGRDLLFFTRAVTLSQQLPMGSAACPYPCGWKEP